MMSLPLIEASSKGRSMNRIIAKVFAVTVAFTAFLHVAPVRAENVAFVSAAGGGSACTQTAPCSSVVEAVISLANGGGRVVCVTPVSQNTSFGFTKGYEFDCPSVSWNAQVDVAVNNNIVLKFQHIVFDGLGSGINMILLNGSGTMIFEDCVFEDIAALALDIEPSGPFNLVMKNSRISNNTGAGVLIKPASGGSVTATFDGVTITNNAGGLRTDTTNGAVRVDIFNSNISNNANNGLIAIGGAGGQNMVSVRNDVIASNGQAGIEASGGSAAVLVNNTLLDSNTAGALSAVSSGRILTYQNNNIVGSAGTGFTGTASPN
jgi:hypothetical protein